MFNRKYIFKWWMFMDFPLVMLVFGCFHKCVKCVPFHPEKKNYQKAEFLRIWKKIQDVLYVYIYMWAYVSSVINKCPAWQQNDLPNKGQLCSRPSLLYHLYTSVGCRSLKFAPPKQESLDIEKLVQHGGELQNQTHLQPLLLALYTDCFCGY